MSDQSRVYVCRIGEIKDAEALRVTSAELPGPVAVFNCDGRLYALSDTCSHGSASLSEGWVENRRVECPLHFSQFDLETGRPCNLPAMDPVKRYDVEVVGESVYLIVPVVQVDGQ